MSKAILEAGKEVLRLAFFAALAAVGGWVAQKVNAFDPTSLQYVIGTVVLRFVDKWVHESKETTLKGIAPF